MQTLIESGELRQVLGVLVGLCAVLMPVAIVFIVLHFRHRRSTETLATVRYLADKGLPVPVDLLRAGKGDRPGSDPRSMLITSLSTLGAGIGLMIFFYTWTPSAWPAVLAPAAALAAVRRAESRERANMRWTIVGTIAGTIVGALVAALPGSHGPADAVDPTAILLPGLALLLASTVLAWLAISRS